MPYSSMAVANEFLRKPGAIGRLTQMQLLKLVYIAHGWNLAVNGEPLVHESFHAWDYGPVAPELYDHLKYNGTQPIGRLIESTDNVANRFFNKGREAESYVADLTPEEKDVIDRVWQRYGQFSAFKLSNLTHQPGTPWFDAYFTDRRSAVIPNESIREHYIELAKAA